MYLLIVFFIEPLICNNQHIMNFLDTFIKGTIGNFKSLINSYPDVIYSTDILGKTLLHVAFKYKDEEKIKLLIDLGADINATYKTFTGEVESTLRHYLDTSDDEIIYLLIKYGVKVNTDFIAEYDDAKMLLEAGMNPNILYDYKPFDPITKVDIDVFTLFIEHGAQIDKIDKVGNTHLHNVNKYKNSPKKVYNLVKLLISKKVDISKLNNQNVSALNLFANNAENFDAIHYIASCTNQDEVITVLKDMKKKYKKRENKPWLNYQKRLLKSIDVLEKVLFNRYSNINYHEVFFDDVNPELLYKDKSFPAHNIFYYNNHKVTRLVHNGFDINKLDIRGNALIHYIYAHSDKDFLVNCINNGANVNLKNSYGLTLMHIILDKYKRNDQKQENTDIIEELLKSGYDLNIKNNEGKDFIELIFEYELFETDLFKLVLMHGKNIDFTKEYDDLTIYNACYLKCEEDSDVFKFIPTNQTDYAMLLYKAIITNIDCKKLLNLLKKINDDGFELVSFRDQNADSLLHIPSLFTIKYKEVYTYLCSVFKEKNRMDDFNMRGYTPLHQVCNFSYLNSFNDECIDMLVENGANLNIKNREGYTPLIIGVYYYIKKGKCELVEKLIKLGASIYPKDNNDISVMSYARKLCNSSTFTRMQCSKLNELLQNET